MKILAVIPARGGSKGVPRKNIRLLCGKPLIQYTIDAALACPLLDEVMVSTEDVEIADVVHTLGAKIPFMRPTYLANDSSPTLDTIIHVIEEYKNLDIEFDAVCLLQPTVPFRSKNIISKCVETFIGSDCDSLISVREVPHEFNPHWTFKDSDNNGLLTIATGDANIVARRQDLPKAFYRDGAVYLTKVSVILHQGSLYGNKITYFNSQEEPYVNIDTMKDWKNAEDILSESK